MSDWLLALLVLLGMAYTVGNIIGFIYTFIEMDLFPAHPNEVYELVEVNHFGSYVLFILYIIALPLSFLTKFSYYICTVGR